MPALFNLLFHAILLPKSGSEIGCPVFFSEEVDSRKIYNWKNTKIEIGCPKFHTDTVISAGCIIWIMKKTSVTLQMLHLYWSTVLQSICNLSEAHGFWNACLFFFWAANCTETKLVTIPCNGIVVKWDVTPHNCAQKWNPKLMPSL